MKITHLHITNNNLIDLLSPCNDLETIAAHQRVLKAIVEGWKVGSIGGIMIKNGRLRSKPKVETWLISIQIWLGGVGNMQIEHIDFECYSNAVTHRIHTHGS